jgi:hypothetical protein
LMQRSCTPKAHAKLMLVGFKSHWPRFVCLAL